MPFIHFATEISNAFISICGKMRYHPFAMNHQANHIVDQLIGHLDHGLRSMFVKPKAERASPAEALEEDPISELPRLQEQAGALMRVNHVGEVCAQALYQGQALTSRSEDVREKMQEAAREEIDHLNWCYQRIQELDSHTSHLNPLWYLGSFTIGVCAGLAGDKWSLGFLAETERQVVDHLKSHLDRLPKEDIQSRKIIAQMIEDETHHAHMAEESGAAELPQTIKTAMRTTAKLMTTLSERI